MGKYILDNNTIVENASISVTHPALLNGDGLFTTFLIEDGRAIFFYEHQDRLRKQSSSLRMDFKGIALPYLKTLISKNKAKKGLWRAKIVLLPDRPYLSINSNEKREIDRTLIFLEPYEKKEGPVSLCLFDQEVLVPTKSLKTLSYFHRHYIMAYALKKGFDDALVSYQGALLETAFANFFWIEEDTLYYPPKGLPYLLGITLSQTLDAAKTIGLKIVERKTSFEELDPKYPVFLSNALMGLRPVSKIEAIFFQRYFVLEERLQAAFTNLCKERSILLV